MLPVLQREGCIAVRFLCGFTSPERLLGDFIVITAAIFLSFLADRTIGRAFGTMCRLSVCLSSVTFCIVAKRYVLAKNCLKK